MPLKDYYKVWYNSSYELSGSPWIVGDFGYYPNGMPAHKFPLTFHTEELANKVCALLNEEANKAQNPN